MLDGIKDLLISIDSSSFVTCTYTSVVGRGRTGAGSISEPIGDVLELVLGALTKVLGSPLKVGTGLLSLFGRGLLVADGVLDGIKDLSRQQSNSSI